MIFFAGTPNKSNEYKLKNTGKSFVKNSNIIYMKKQKQQKMRNNIFRNLVHT